MAAQQHAASGGRTPEQIREHYEIEKGLADRLRRAGKEERRTLYTTVYDELFRRVPHHQQLTRKVDAAAKARAVAWLVKFLDRFLYPGSVYLEVGPGDCALAVAMTGRARQVYAVDVSDEITKSAGFPPNFQLILSDGCSIPVPERSVDLAFSNQLMEHLHPDDAMEQLRNIHASMVEGGRYVCITPNRLTGPHDISRHYDDVATGLHLKEYTAGELADMFRNAGFTDVSVFVGIRGRYVQVPLVMAVLLESLAEALPRVLRRKVMKWRLFRMLFGVVLAAQK